MTKVRLLRSSSCCHWDRLSNCCCKSEQIHWCRCHSYTLTRVWCKSTKFRIDSSETNRLDHPDSCLVCNTIDSYKIKPELYFPSPLVGISGRSAETLASLTLAPLSGTVKQSMGQLIIVRLLQGQPTYRRCSSEVYLERYSPRSPPQCGHLYSSPQAETDCPWHHHLSCSWSDEYL